MKMRAVVHDDLRGIVFVVIICIFERWRWVGVRACFYGVSCIDGEDEA